MNERAEEDTHDQRGTLTPVWERLHEHERDLRDLNKGQAEAHQRINGTEQVVANVHQELRDWKEQTHKDSAAILSELREANRQTQTTSEKAEETAAIIKTLKWAVPTAVAGTGALFGMLTFLVKAGVIG